MRLLFDENISQRLVALVSEYFPGSLHVEIVAARGATDTRIWDFAKEHNITIVSKDNDFRQRALLLGPPPKVVFLSVRNARTQAIAVLLTINVDRLHQFFADPIEGLLVLS